MASTNKIKYGLKNVYYAVATESTDATTGAVTITYATPVAIKGAVELSIKAEGGLEGFSADDNANYATIYTNNGYSGDLTIANIPDSFRTACLGETVDTDGLVLENADQRLSHFALLFEINGDVKARRSVYYWCVASRPDIASKSTSDKNEPQTDKLSITIGKHPVSGDVKLSTSETTTSTIYDAWFSAVKEIA